jgi:hypothetical protein
MDGLNSILQLPDRCIVNKKITKAFFKRNFDLTSSERALLDDAHIISDISWIANVNPASANIIAWKDDQFTFEEVQIISVLTNTLDFERSYPRIAELIQKYIPYPILLFVYNTEGFIANTCDKKINQNDSSRRTIEKRYFTKTLTINGGDEVQKAFLESLKFTNLDKTNLLTYYNAYTQRIISLQVSNLSGAFQPRTHSRTKEDIARLESIELLNTEISSLQVQAKKETQLNQRVQLNLTINQKRKEIERLTALLSLL